MIEPIPVYGEQAYSILYNRFGGQPFSPGYFKWFLSPQMSKKTVYLLQKKGWITRVGRAQYACAKPERIISGMVEFKVPALLEKSGKKYSYTKMSAVEVWTDFTYLQRSWEHSPYFLKVLKTDLRFWKSYFKPHYIKSFVNKTGQALGEFVVLIPVEKLDPTVYNNKPTDKIEAVAAFCKQNIETFEYPLAYLVKKFGLAKDPGIDQRVMEAVKI